MKKAIKEVIDNILEVAQRERESSEPYKDMFKRTEGKPFCIQLMDLESDMMHIVLNYTSILEANGYKVSNETFKFLYSLPLLAHTLEEDIRKKEGRTCCVDKTYKLLHKELEKLLYN